MAHDNRGPTLVADVPTGVLNHHISSSLSISQPESLNEEVVNRPRTEDAKPSAPEESADALTLPSLYARWSSINMTATLAVVSDTGKSTQATEPLEQSRRRQSAPPDLPVLTWSHTLDPAEPLLPPVSSPINAKEEPVSPSLCLETIEPIADRHLNPVSSDASRGSPNPIATHAPPPSIGSSLICAGSTENYVDEEGDVDEVASFSAPAVDLLAPLGSDEPDDILVWDTTTDAGYESDIVTAASTSVESAILQHAFENGRRYHRFREGQYNFPNDDVEQQREDMKHSLFRLLCRQLHFAPLEKNIQEIIDLGTGTGTWAIEIGDSFPRATILGIDLSPIQPAWVPPNVKFQIDDFESVWLHPPNHFDYVHSRHIVMAVKDWNQLLQHSYEHLRPGGWVEMQEVHHFPISANNTSIEENPIARYWNHVADGLNDLGIDLRFSKEGHMGEVMRGCGYINVQERVFQVPIGTWPQSPNLKKVGLFWKTILQDGIQAIALGPLTRGLKWSLAEVEAFLVSVRKAYTDDSAMLYMPLVVAYGQKPM